MQIRKLSEGGGVCIDGVITDFRGKLVEPLFADITRTLEVTCHKSGKENHGSNFIGNAVVLSGIETLAQFIDPNSEEKHRAFRKQAEEHYNKLDKETQNYVAPKPGPRDGSKLATDFMKKYFASVFRKKEFGVPLYKLIWEFRNPHMHTFYPYYQKTFGTKKVSGGVDWLYQDPSDKRIGITIEKVEENFDAYKEKLYRIEVDWFRICPHILFVFFRQAVNNKFIAEICNNADVQHRFCDNYKRLAKSYDFEDLTKRFT